MKTNLKLIPTKNHNQFQVQLNLGFETRHIGTLEIQGKTFTTKRNASQIFRETNSIGLNDELLTDKSIRFQWVVVNYLDAEGTKHKLVTSRNFFLHYSKFLEFYNEPQRFLKLCDFGIEKAREFERQKALQEKLFSEVA